MNAPQAVSELYSHSSRIVNPSVFVLTTGYTDFANKPITDLRLSNWAFRIHAFLQSMCRPGQPFVHIKHSDIAETFGVSHDTVERATSQLVAAGYVSRVRQRGEDGRLLDYVYDLTPTLLLLPETQSAFRRTGVKPLASQTSVSPTTPVCVDKKDESAGYVMSLEHKHQPTRKPKEKVKPPVVYNLSNEEMDTVTELESCGIVGSAPYLVKTFGVIYCRKYIAWIQKAYPGEKKGGLIFKAITKRYDISSMSPQSTETCPEPARPAHGKQLERETLHVPPAGTGLALLRERMKRGVFCKGATNTEGLKQ